MSMGLLTCKFTIKHLNVVAFTTTTLVHMYLNNTVVIEMVNANQVIGYQGN